MISRGSTVGGNMRNIGNRKGKGRSDVFIFHRNIIKI